MNRGTGFAFLPYFNTTNSAANHKWAVDFIFSHNGTDWTTDYMSVTNTLNGNTAQRGYNPVPATSLPDVLYARPFRARNLGTNTIWNTNATASVWK